MRERREKECFRIINRGVLWYNLLTYEQQAELRDWYLKWLDAPETLYAPPSPEWLKNKLNKEEEIV